MTTQVDKELLSRLLSDDRLCIETFFKIPHKDPKVGLVPFKLKSHQLKVLEAMAKYRRVFVLKPRQIGITSAVSAVLLRRTMYTPYSNALIMAHKSDVTERVFKKTTTFYNGIPEAIRPPISGDSRSYKEFSSIDSSIYIETAGSKVSGRSSTVTDLHCSEIAFWEPNAIDNVLKPAMQSVPLSGSVTLESTPNGEGNYAHEEVERILKGESIFHLVVIYWFEEEDYQIAEGTEFLDSFPEFRDDFEYTPEEQALVNKYELSKAQIRWRRYKLVEMGDLFFQEYIEDLSTCFLQLGAPFYDAHLTTLLSQQTRKPIKTIDGWDVWEEPRKDVDYIMGVDPGQARQTQSAACIIYMGDKGKPHMVAKRAALIEPDYFGSICMQMGWLYNTALINPEANSQGIAFIDAIKGKYPRIYVRRDIVSGITTQRLGWYTNTATKPRMMEELNYHLRNIDLPDAETLRQIRGFRALGDGRAEATTADDQHDALCLALAATIGRTSKRSKAFSSGFTKWDKR